MAERTVVWKAVADFSSIARDAAKARKELDALEEKSKGYGKSSEQSSNQQVSSHQKVADSLHKVAKAAEESGNRQVTTDKKVVGSHETVVKATDAVRKAVGALADAREKDADETKKSASASDIARRALERLSQARKQESDATTKAVSATEFARRKVEELAEAQKKVSESNEKTIGTSRTLRGALGDLARAVRDVSTAQRDQAGATAGATAEVKKHGEEISQTSTKHKGFKTDIDKSALAISRLKSALASMMAGGGAASVIQRLGSSLTSMDAATRRNTSSWTIFASAVNNFKGQWTLGIVTRLGTMVGLLGTLAAGAVDGVGALAGAVASLGTGLVGMVGALSPAIGLLGALPGLVAAGVGAFATTIASLKGVGGAMKAYEQQQKKASTTANTAAKRAQDNNRRLAQSEQGLANARRTSARAIRDAERSIRDARENAARVMVDTARQITSAEKNVERAKNGVVDAERNLVRAQESVNRAREGAVQQLKDLTRASKSYILQEEGAALSLEESRKRLTEVMNDPGSSDLQRRQASLSVREAEARLEEVRESAAETNKELAEAQRKGIEGSDQVVSALESEQEATAAIMQAKEGVAEAESDLARTREDAARSVRDANEAVVRANENLEEAQINAAQATERAADAMTQAAEAASAGAQETDLFAEAMAKLTPEARAVVYQLLAMKDGWEAIRKATERAVLPGVLVFLQSVEKLFPTILEYAGKMGGVMGGFFADLGRMMSSPDAIKTWVIVLDDAVRIMENWRIGLLNIGQVLANIARAAAVSGLNDWLGEVLVGWTETWKALTSGEEGQARLITFFEKTMERAELLGSIIGGLVGFFFNVGQAGDEAGMKIWTSFDNALKRFNDWANTEGGFNAIKAVADASVPVFEQLGLLIVDIAKGMGRLAVEGNPGEFIRLVRTELGPVLMDIIRTLRESDVLNNFVRMLGKLGRTLVSSGLLKNFAEFANDLMTFAEEALPALAPAINVLIDVLGGLVKGLTYVFREMNKGSAIGTAFKVVLGAIAALLLTFGFGALVLKIRNLVKSFRDGFRDIGSLVAKFGDSVKKPLDKVVEAIDRVTDAIKRMPDRIDTPDVGPQRSAGKADFGAQPGIPRRAIDPDVERRLAREARRAGEKHGDEYAEGIEDGLKGGEAEVRRAAKDVGDEIDKGVKEEASPRKGDKVGEDFAEAVADGAKDEKRSVRKAGEDIGEELVDGAEDEVKKGRSRISGALKFVGGALLAGGTMAAGGAFSIGTSALGSWERLRAEIAKTQGVFGSASRDMETWADTAAVTMNTSKGAVLEVANQFGTLFQNMGKSKEESVPLAQNMAILAGQLAAANPGIDLNDAYGALEDALNGNYETLGKLNPALGTTEVMERALRDTGKQTNEQLTDQDKLAAFLAISQEEAARTAEEHAKQQEGLGTKTDETRGKWERFKEKLGEKLDTQLAPVVDELGKLLDNEQAIEDFATVLSGLAAALVAVTGALAGAMRQSDRDAQINRESREAGVYATDKVRDERVRRRTEELEKLTDEQVKLRGQRIGVNPLYLNGTPEAVRDKVAKAEVNREIVAERDRAGITAEEAKALEEERKRAEKANPPRNYGAGVTNRGAAPGSPAQRGVPAQGNQVGKDVVAGVEQGMEDAGKDFETAIDKWVNKWLFGPIKRILGIESPSTVFAGYGGDLIQGLFNGIITKIMEAPGKLRTWFENHILTPVKNFFGINSPSTVFDGYGKDIIQGLFNGILIKILEAPGKIRQWFTDNVLTPVKNFFGIQSPSTVFDGYGKDIIQGLFNGILTKILEAPANLRRWFNENVLDPVKRHLGIASPSTVFRGFGIDLIQGLLNGIDSMWSRAMTAASNFVTEMARRFGELGDKVRGPAQVVVDVVYNNGIRTMWNAIAGIVKLDPLPPVTLGGGGGNNRQATAGRGLVPRDVGGYTGPGPTMQPAGIVHADEYVIRKKSRRKFERDNPGLLDHINRTGTLTARGYRDGGLVEGRVPFQGGAHPVGSSFPEYFFGGNATVPPGKISQHRSGYSFARWAGDLARPQGTPISAWKSGTVASNYFAPGSYGWHVRINHPNGEQSLYAHMMSRAPVNPGQEVSAGQVIGRVGSTGNSSGPHLHFEIRGGSAPLGAMGSGEAAGSFFTSAFDRMKSLVTEPLQELRAKYGDSPWVDSMVKLTTTAASQAKAWADSKLDAITDSITAAAAGIVGAAGVPGSLGNIGVTAATARKGEEIVATARKAGHRISTVGGYRSDGEHVTRRALDLMVGLSAAGRAAGDFISSFVLANKLRYGLQHVIWAQRINSGDARGWRAMANRGSPTQNHFDHPHVLFNSRDVMPQFDVGGWTGRGPRMQPAGIVHADEFVIKKPSRQKFERNNPGALDHINRTGTLPGYHQGGIVRTGGEGGTWWRKGTYSLTGKWIGALRHFFGLDDWWGGWDDALDNAIRNYDGRPATHVYLPEWRPTMDAMRRLPLSEYGGGVQGVAGKIGVHPDRIFRMLDTNRAHFNRDLGDPAKVNALEPSYARFRDFHRESVEELQTVLGVPVDGYWNMRMRELLSHVKQHVTGAAHPDNLPTGDGWSTVGSWGDAFNEVLRTNRLNAEWDRMMDQFYVWGFDSLIRHLESQGVSQGMELARDLFNVRDNARDADAYYREFYEREDRINDQNSELNRLRKVVNYLRRYDNVGLQGLASELELTMDTTAMLFKKAQSSGMLSGIGQSKISRLEKDVIDFDKIFRFALGGVVPGSGNMDSVLALLTPGEYVLTKEQTKSLMQFARYQAPSMVGGVPGLASAQSAAATIINKNTTNNVTATIVSPNPRLAGVAFQKKMKKLSDNGLFGMEDDSE